MSANPLGKDARAVATMFRASRSSLIFPLSTWEQAGDATHRDAISVRPLYCHCMPRSRQIRKIDNPIFSEQGGLLRTESIDAQICALPPSTKSSMPVTKLESSEARNRAALATSSASPMRPIGMVDKILAIAS
jgi:hypothetical protein